MVYLLINHKPCMVDLAEFQKVVIRTKSVEFMPITLSVLLTVSAIMWMAYGILLRDIYVTVSTKKIQRKNDNSF